MKLWIEVNFVNVGHNTKHFSNKIKVGYPIFLFTFLVLFLVGCCVLFGHVRRDEIDRNITGFYTLCFPGKIHSISIVLYCCFLLVVSGYVCLRVYNISWGCNCNSKEKSWHAKLYEKPKNTMKAIICNKRS